MDRLIKALSAGTRIRVTAVDVTMSATALEARHLAGPTAGKVLAESLAVAALLTADAEPGEAVTLQLKVGGPLQGVLVDARGNGDLRGFTQVKILNELDGRPTIDTAEALGPAGTVQFTRSTSTQVSYRTPLALQPPQPRLALARFLNISMQVPAAVELAVRADASGVLLARGLIAERMPDGDPAAFVKVVERFNDGTVATALLQPDALDRLDQVTGLPDLVTGATRPLQFNCPCSEEKAVAVLDVLTTEELDERIASGQPQNVICHMCGREHAVSVAALTALVAKRRQGAGPARGV